MTRDDLAKLRALAEAATLGPCNHGGYDCEGNDYCFERRVARRKLADAASPAAVLSLLDELARVRRLAEEASELAIKMRDDAAKQYTGEPAHLHRTSCRIAAIREEIGK